ncbi:MAG: hypothetical protein ACJA0H_001688 [Francisellaceae bacterium]|jgi:hypothetical protein
MNLNIVGYQLRINTAGSNGTQLYWDRFFTHVSFDKTGVIFTDRSVEKGQNINKTSKVHIKFAEFSYAGDASSYVTEAAIATLFSTILKAA